MGVRVLSISVWRTVGILRNCPDGPDCTFRGLCVIIWCWLSILPSEKNKSSCCRGDITFPITSLSSILHNGFKPIINLWISCIRFISSNLSKDMAIYQVVCYIPNFLWCERCLCPDWHVPLNCLIITRKFILYRQAVRFVGCSGAKYPLCALPITDRKENCKSGLISESFRRASGLDHTMKSHGLKLCWSSNTNFLHLENTVLL